MAFGVFEAAAKSLGSWSVQGEGELFSFTSQYRLDSRAVYQGTVVMSDIAKLKLRQWGFQRGSGC